MADCNVYVFVYTIEPIVRSVLYAYFTYVHAVHRATSLQETSVLLTEILTSQRISSIQPSSSNNIHLLSLDKSEMKVRMTLYVYMCIQCTYVYTLFVCVAWSIHVNTISHTQTQTRTYVHTCTHKQHTHANTWAY